MAADGSNEGGEGGPSLRRKTGASPPRRLLLSGDFHLRNLASLAVAGVAAAALLVPLGSASAGIVRVGGNVQNHGLNFAKPFSLGRIYMPTISYHKMHPQTC